MLAAERRKKIYELVDEQTSVKVADLSNLFSVTEETIRRDLEKLEKENKIKRLHGGAVKVSSNDSEVHFTEREILHVEEKRAIAAEAAKLISEGDKIILDASTTAWCLARCLPNISITVITNSVQVVNELMEKDRIEVICIGGRYSAKSHSFIGPLSERSLDNYHVHKAFISCKGVHITNGVRDSSELQALLKRQMIAHCEEAILMVDNSKVNAHSFSHIAPLSFIHTIICDDKIDKNFKLQAEEIGVNVKTVSL
ncbi:DeoR/GlpR family DNA-binding transcription regulator [Lysinibacillus telephonicus]|uniref:DeoR/GlpR transcriptional regulator n=1 Tax=Lysinibacillus telephonicus TaxID=1714840 RepID=A0A431UX88_9BACI|nr:DeoR/GlpR family DNA-binding transcription regulator [Lysinibacillus telephonicus]RTQ96254.1 DeoR/GlpR transcriptional regulator [Lysinibacillus telephonicus]